MLDIPQARRDPFGEKLRAFLLERLKRLTSKSVSPSATSFGVKVQSLGRRFISATYSLRCFGTEYGIARRCLFLSRTTNDSRRAFLIDESNLH